MALVLRAAHGRIALAGLALVIAVPVSFGIAIFLTELSPPWLRRPLGTAIELLAAIPSISATSAPCGSQTGVGAVMSVPCGGRDRWSATRNG